LQPAKEIHAGLTVAVEDSDDIATGRGRRPDYIKVQAERAME